MSILQPNRVRHKLRAGARVVGTAIYSASPNMVEAVGRSGIDFIRIDTEHGWRQDDSLDNMIRAANYTGITAIVRVDRDDANLVRKALELGAGGIVVPHVYTADYAREVVASAKFPPRGVRGFGNLCSSGAWGAVPAAEWVSWSDSEPVIGVMIESVQAMDEIEAIMAIDGLDFALFGPADYSLSLGLGAPQTEHPKVQEGLDRTIAAARKAGKHVMFGVGYDEAKAKAYVERGVSMIEIGHDVAIVQGFLADKARTFD